MDADQEQIACTEMTGLAPRHQTGGQFYDDHGNRISDTRARQLFRQSTAIHVPNAGAGSFRAVLARLGFKRVTVEEWGNSSGDWTFRVRGGFVSQNNRYPHYGFSYYLSRA